jgi:SSS family solute:Na+ symporter
MGAVLSTFNSVLNSTATIFSEGIYKRLLHKEATGHQMVRAGKMISIVLAVVAILAAPMVAGAPEGLYQLLQQLNGIFFIPIASIMLAGLFIPKVTATAAKAALFVGLGFYILTTFILDVDIHFVHIWGIEFVLNMVIMLVLSRIYPHTVKPVQKPEVDVTLLPWKYTRIMSVILVITIILIYIWLGQ